MRTANKIYLIAGWFLEKRHADLYEKSRNLCYQEMLPRMFYCVGDRVNAFTRSLEAEFGYIANEWRLDYEKQRAETS